MKTKQEKKKKELETYSSFRIRMMGQQFDVCSYFAPFPKNEFPQIKHEKLPLFSRVPLYVYAG